MFQVYTMYGDNEPWWFFEDWEKDVKEIKNFDTLDQAAAYYKEVWRQFTADYTYHNTKNNFLSAFWNEDDERWCEECDDYLQQYWGIALLENKQPVTIDSGKDQDETTNTSGKAKCCKRLKQGA